MKILLRNLTKRFPDRNKKTRGEITAVNDLTLEIPDGKLVGLLGPSGCGKSTTLNLIAVAVLIYSYFRIFSRNIARRQAENQKFLKITAPVRSLFGKKSADKTHRIFSCPKCGQKMRVPMGKGKIEITCPNCRNKFIKRS